MFCKIFNEQLRGTHEENSVQNWCAFFNPLSTNTTKWWNTLKQFAGNLPTNFLTVFDHFVKLALKGLKNFLI